MRRNANNNPRPETLDMYAGMSSGPVVSSAASRMREAEQSAYVCEYYIYIKYVYKKKKLY